MPHTLYLASGESMADAIDDMGDKHAFIGLMLTRREIEAGLVGDAVDRLMVLSDSADYTRRFGNSVAVVVQGYDDDPRELHEVPECRRFLRNITAQWPYWFHFAHRGRSDGHLSNLGVVVTLLIDSEPVPAAAGEMAAQINTDSWNEVIRSLWDGLNGLYAQHDLPVQELADTTNAVNTDLDALFANPGDGE